MIDMSIRHPSEAVEQRAEWKLELRERPGMKLCALGSQRHVDWRIDEITAGASDFKESTI